MKKINKLAIDPQKIMRSEELIKLKGGSGYIWCYSEYVAGSGVCNNYLGPAYWGGAGCLYGDEAVLICQASYPGSSGCAVVPAGMDC